MRKLFGIFIAIVFVVSTIEAQTSDAALRRATEADAAAKASNGGKLPTLAAAEHLSRAEAYMANRLFPQAREHWAIVMDKHPDDAGIPKALFGTARSYMWEREYLKAVDWFDKLIKDHLGTKDGREGLAFKGASYVRAGKNLEAAKTYEQYVSMFPEGEKIESAHLNIIDAYREAGDFAKADQWVRRTAATFNGKPSEVNALHAKLRMEISRSNWNAAVSTADELDGKRFVGSMTSSDEVMYLRAFAYEKSSRLKEALAAYGLIKANNNSYYSGLAFDRRMHLITLGGSVASSETFPKPSASEYPILFSPQVIKHAKKNKIDPRFVLAIMKQESSFKANAKSPAGARGLVQLVYDTAIKYKDEAGYKNLTPDDLYNPETNVAIGSIYIRKIKDEFGGLYEAVAASYNAGEDNAARWLNRTKPKEPGVFAAEVGFAETKNYVFKVMNNYRVYRELYDENLNRK